MSYKVTYRGVTIECEGVEDAIQLAQRLGGEPGSISTTVFAPVAVAEVGRGGRLDASRFQEFIGYLDQRQKSILQLLVANPHGKTDKSIRQNLGLQGGKALGGTLSGISKLANKAGLSIDDVYTVHKVKVGEENLREFRVRSNFKKLADEVGLK